MLCLLAYCLVFINICSLISFNSAFLLKKEFISLGGIFKKAEVTSISNNQVILKDSNIISADKILICSGIWSKKLLKNIKHKVNIEAERGFHIVLKKM